MITRWIISLLLVPALLSIHAACLAESHSKPGKTDSIHDTPSPIETLRYPITEESKQIITKHTDRYNQADTAYKDYEPVKAHAIWHSLAVEGNMNAQFRLGQMRQKGQGIPVDLNRAKAWYRKAAIQGHADAMVALGRMLNSGGATVYGPLPKPPYGRLIKSPGSGEPNWFAQAAAAYANKNGIASKTKRALAIFASIHNIDANSSYITSEQPEIVSARATAEKLLHEIDTSDKTQFEKKASAEDFYLLAILTHPLTHIEPNNHASNNEHKKNQRFITWVNKSKGWMKKSVDMEYLPAVNDYRTYASLGVPSHMLRAGAILSSGEISAKLQLSSAKMYQWTAILKYLSKKRGRDFVSAAYSRSSGEILLSACRLGKNVFSERLKRSKLEARNKDAEEVIVWLEKHGIIPELIERYEIHCYFGNAEKARNILHEAASNNDPKAQRSLATAYFQGIIGHKKDPTKAQKVASKAIATYKHLSEQGDIKASAALAAELLQGTFIEKDPGQAYSLYKSAAEQGHPESYKILSFLYAYGLGTSKDEAKAYYWYTKALAQLPSLHYSNPLKDQLKSATISPELSDAINRYEKALITLPYAK